MFSRINILTLVCATVILCSCNSGTSSNHILTVSIEPQRYLLEQIAGDQWEVNTMLSAGANPETFDPPISALKSATNSAAYFKVGSIPFEEILISKIGAGMRVVDTANGITLLHGTHNCDNHNHNHNNNADPHIWSSVRNAKIMAQNMRDAMIELDAENSAKYQQNYTRLTLMLDSLDQEIIQILNKKTNKTFVTWHPSLSYFARDYSLNQLAIGSEGKEMSIDAFRGKIDEIKSIKAEVMLVQPEMDNNRSKEIANQTGIKTVTVNLLSYDWAEQMILVAKSL